MQQLIRNANPKLKNKQVPKYKAWIANYLRSLSK